MNDQARPWALWLGLAFVILMLLISFAEEIVTAIRLVLTP